MIEAIDVCAFAGAFAGVVIFATGSVAGLLETGVYESS